MIMWYLGIWSDGRIDRGVLQQGEEHEEDADPGPEIHGLGTVDI